MLTRFLALVIVCGLTQCAVGTTTSSDEKIIRDKTVECAVTVGNGGLIAKYTSLKANKKVVAFELSLSLSNIPKNLDDLSKFQPYELLDQCQWNHLITDKHIQELLDKLGFKSPGTMHYVGYGLLFFVKSTDEAENTRIMKKITDGYALDTLWQGNDKDNVCFFRSKLIVGGLKDDLQIFGFVTREVDSLNPSPGNPIQRFNKYEVYGTSAARKGLESKKLAEIFNEFTGTQILDSNGATPLLNLPKEAGDSLAGLSQSKIKVDRRNLLSQSGESAQGLNPVKAMIFV